MELWLHKIEVIVDKSIPYLVALIMIIILGEFFYHKSLIQYERLINIIDAVIIGIFIIDLIFKYVRVRDAKTFIKKYWLEIIAVFPFFLLFRLFEELTLFFRLGGGLREGQEILHSGIEVERVVKEIREVEKVDREAARIFREIGEGSKLTRLSLFERLIRPISRIPRMLMVYRRVTRAALVYEKPYKKD
ncbi:MAG: hypothetical protein AABX55_01780 [Nanoarchaeota archaeon]